MNESMTAVKFRTSVYSAMFSVTEAWTILAEFC